MPENFLDVSAVSDKELSDRYNLDKEKLKQLQEEIEAIRAEMGRRETLKKGGTFTLEAIDRMRHFFVENAAQMRPKNCIKTMNKGIRDLFADPDQPVGTAVHKTMEKLYDCGRASSPRIIQFNDARGRMTTGVRRPETLQENVLETMLETAKNKIGWSVFGTSIMDGYHSVTLTLYTGNPEEPVIYWSDQWKSRKGWQEFNKVNLDEEITKLTQKWWDKKEPQKKPRTRLTLWRLLPR